MPSAILSYTRLPGQPQKNWFSQGCNWAEQYTCTSYSMHAMWMEHCICMPHFGMSFQGIRWFSGRAERNFSTIPKKEVILEAWRTDRGSFISRYQAIVMGPNPSRRSPSIGRAITGTHHRDLISGEPIKFWVGMDEAQNGDTCDAVAGADESNNHLSVSELRKRVNWVRLSAVNAREVVSKISNQMWCCWVL